MMTLNFKKTLPKALLLLIAFSNQGNAAQPNTDCLIFRAGMKCIAEGNGQTEEKLAACVSKLVGRKVSINRIKNASCEIDLSESVAPEEESQVTPVNLDASGAPAVTAI